jgi:hypothetical protein
MGTSTVRNAVILGGHIRARGTQGGAGIGSGRATDKGTSRVDNLTILSGTINATGSFAPGIGAGQGQDGDAVSRVTNLTIVSGNISAISSRFGAGIGARSANDRGQSLLSNLTIVNATIVAVGSEGAGIGAGYSDARHSPVGNITILNGRINATGGWIGAGIGAGLADTGGNTNVAFMRIAGGEIIATGAEAAAIGFGSGGGGVAGIIFSGKPKVIAKPGKGLRAVDAKSVTLANATLLLTATAAPAFAVAPTATGTGTSDLTVLYNNTTTAITEPLSALPGTFLQIGSLVLAAGRRWTVAITLSTFTKTFEFDGSDVKSFVSSVFGLGTYHLTASSTTENGQLVKSDGQSTFVVNTSRTFFPLARFAVNTPPTLTRTSAPSWGTFPSSGPTGDQAIDFVLADPDSDQTWTVFWRFDSEAWRNGGLVVTGANSFVFSSSLFTGTRIRSGTHTLSLYVTDSGDSASNIISVSYNVASSSGLGGVAPRPVAVVAVLAVAAALVHFWSSRRGQKAVVGESEADSPAVIA